MFTQLDGSLSGRTEVWHPASPLAKQLVELHGGSIQARSEGIGRGSEFSVRLPIVLTARRRRAGSRETRPRRATASIASCRG